MEKFYWMLDANDNSLQQSIRSLWHATCSRGINVDDAVDATSLLHCFAMSTEKERPAMGEP